MRASGRVTPIWLRPVAFAAIGLLHAGVFVGAPWPQAEPPAVAAPLAVRVVPMGKVAEAIDAPELAQVAEVTAVATPASAAQPAEATEIRPETELRPESEVRPESEITPENVTEALAAPDGKPVDEPGTRETTDDARVAEVPALAPEAAVKAVVAETTDLDVPQPKPRPARTPDRPQRTTHRTTAARAPSQASAVAHRSRAEAVTGPVAGADYRALVAAELNRRKFYPPAARASGIEGTVVVTFSVGGGGRVSGHRIVRSSGQPVLDRAVDRMLATLSLPPPPGGVFRATVPIRFGLR